jgi:hypothetical protein
MGWITAHPTLPLVSASTAVRFRERSCNGMTQTRSHRESPFYLDQAIGYNQVQSEPPYDRLIYFVGGHGMARPSTYPQELFSAMQHIRETALVRFDSLFSPEKNLWTLQNLRRFHALFVGRWDAGEGSFFEKLRKQLEGADDDILQLSAELLYVQQWFTRVTGSERKLENVRTVLDWCAHPVPIPEWAVLGVQSGVSRDQSFNQYRPHQIAWLSEFLIHWQELSERDRTAMLGDPWRFAQEVHSVECSKGAYQPMQEAWLYIAFPDTFENISSRKDKRRIRDAFSNQLKNGPTDNIDNDLLEIRKELSKQQGEDFHFYLSPVVEHWREATTTGQNGVSISSRDIELIRQSRSHDRYSDFSIEEKTAYKRVHEALRELAQTVIAELGGARDYTLKLTSGFHPVSGIRGGKPKDLWFGVYRKENEKSFLANPQIFMIVSGRGIEYGFSPLTHPDDFSNQEIKQRTRAIAKSILEQLPTPASPEAKDLEIELTKAGGWYFRRKQRLDPKQSEFKSLDDWLSFVHSDAGAQNAGGGITRYTLADEIEEVDLPEEVRQIARLFRPLMERIVADAPPAIAPSPPQTALPVPGRNPPVAGFGDLLRIFLDEFANARSGPFQKTESLWNAMSNLKTRLEQFPAVQTRPELLINVSVGLGNWATVPWIAVLNTRITQSTQEGIYIVFLVATNLDRVFLTLNQGTTDLVREHGQHEAHKRMLDVAKKTRPLIFGLADAGFILNNEIELGGTGWLSKNYEVGTIAHVNFGVNEIPDDNRMNELLKAALDAYDRAVDARPIEPATPGAIQPPSSAEPYDMDDALSELFLEQSSVERLLTIWEEKKNLILQGAPGVGKTFVAKRLAYLLLGAKDSARVDTVQFHQSYSYEDFVQGYRPDGRGGFTLRDGVFHRFCEKATLSPGHPHVFIIDEINRGNLAKILGELMLLIEHDKRGPSWATTLTYSEPGEPLFFVPENLYLLGMMNTADRSLSIVDYALRRRFSFALLEPMFGSEKFHELLVTRGVPESVVELIVARMTALNKAIAEDRANLGSGYRIGHSFFVPPEGFEYDPSWYRRIVETEIHPLLEEYWIDDPDKADGWRQQLL